MKQKNLVDKILEASSMISNKSRRGSSDWFIVPSSIADMLRSKKRDIRKEKIKKVFSE